MVTTVDRRSRWRRVAHIMGTAISLDIADPLSDAELSRLTGDTFAWLREVDERFSTYRSDSEVSRLDRGELAPHAGKQASPLQTFAQQN